jgi:hypothetical protein
MIPARGAIGSPALPDALGDVFYNELTVERSTPGSYFMACGFTGGYLGIQDLPEEINRDLQRGIRIRKTIPMRSRRINASSS